MVNSGMPLVEAIFEYIDDGIKRYHTPGHKGGQGFSDKLIRNLPLMDLTEVPGLDDLNDPKGAIARAQNLGARAFGGDRTFFLVNGSTAGIHAMILATCPPGSSLIVPRNCHRSVINAMILADVRPIYINPEYSQDLELATQISPKSVEEALEENPDSIGVLLVSPNYYGMCARVEEIGKIVRKREKILMVDEAHGAHLPFSPRLPKSSGKLGADIWVQSAHKTLPAFTQGGYLHIKGNRVLGDRVSNILRIIGTSSPSYMLMASLDWARHIMESRGKELISKLIDEIDRLRFQLKNNTKILSIDSFPCKSVYDFDPTRLVLDFKGLGISGFHGERLLREKYGLQIEMSDHRYGVLICTVADRAEDLMDIVGACKDLEGNYGNIQEPMPTLSISREIPRQILTPREAFYSENEILPLDRSNGRIIAQSIGAYPPGIPRYCPGELMEKEGIEELVALKNLGATLFGIDEMGNIEVIKE